MHSKQIKFSLRSISRKGAFCIALFFTLFSPLFFPSFRGFFFIPFLILTFYQCSFSKTLYTAFSCGLFLDLLSSERLGLFAVSYLLTTYQVFSFRRFLFADRLSTLLVMTFLFSALSTLIHSLLFTLLEAAFPYSIPWIWTDLVLMPGLDACFAFLIFICPLYLSKKLKLSTKIHVMLNSVSL